MRSGKPNGRQPIESDIREPGIRRQAYLRVLTAWWLQRGVYTRSHSELDRENPQRRWYCMVTCGRVGRRQAFKTRFRGQMSGIREQRSENRFQMGTDATADLFAVKNKSSSDFCLLSSGLCPLSSVLCPLSSDACPLASDFPRGGAVR